MKQQSPDKATVRVATAADAESVVGIYNYYVTDTVVTFEEVPVSPSDMAKRIEEVTSASMPWLVAEVGGQVLGYAYANQWKGRTAYRFAAEVTAYVARSHHGIGLGSQLYAELFSILRKRGTHAVIGGIALPNLVSVALHEKFGLEKVAHFKEVGFKFKRWIDVGYWQRTF